MDQYWSTLVYFGEPQSTIGSILILSMYDIVRDNIDQYLVLFLFYQGTYYHSNHSSFVKLIDLHLIPMTSFILILVIGIT